MNTEYNLDVCVELLYMVCDCVSTRMYVLGSQREEGRYEKWQREENKIHLSLDSQNLLIAKFKGRFGFNLTFLTACDTVVTPLAETYPVIPQLSDGWAPIMSQEGLRVRWSASSGSGTLYQGPSGASPSVPLPPPWPSFKHSRPQPAILGGLVSSFPRFLDAHTFPCYPYSNAAQIYKPELQTCTRVCDHYWVFF